MDSNNFDDYLYIKYVKRKILIFNKLYLIILYLKKYECNSIPQSKNKSFNLNFLSTLFKIIYN